MVRHFGLLASIARCGAPQAGLAARRATRRFRRDGARFGRAICSALRASALCRLVFKCLRLPLAVQGRRKSVACTAAVAT
jgi:hypothetical protein